MKKRTGKTLFNCRLKAAVLAASIIAAVVPPALAKLPENKVVATVTVGAYPGGVAVSPNSDYVYVANSGANTVSVINASLNTITATIPVGNAPAFVAITPDGASVFVSNGSDNTVSVISTQTQTVTKTIPVGKGPAGVAVGPDGSQLYVANDFTDSEAGVSIIDIATLAVVKSIKIAGAAFAYQVVFTPDGTAAYVTSLQFIAKIDTASQKVVSAIGSGKIHYPAGLAISPDAATLYESDDKSSGYVFEFYTANDSLKKKLNIGLPGQVAVTPNGSFLYVASQGSSTVIMIKTATSKILGSPIPVGNTPASMAVAPNGKYLYVSNSGGDTVSVIDISP
jgi:large repetitive protein